MVMGRNLSFVVTISADAEWHSVLRMFPNEKLDHTPYGEWFYHVYEPSFGLPDPVIFMQGGWGKVAAAGSIQYALSNWHPALIINIGTCGGFKGEITRGDVILVENTVIYDIIEQMGDPDEHIQHYTTKIDNTWISTPYPLTVIKSLLVSGDRDLIISEIPLLKEKYGAIASDWESGAIAWVCKKNHTSCLILRGVTDLVGEEGGDAYNGQVDYYYHNTQLVMEKLIGSLPFWLRNAVEYYQRMPPKIANGQ